MEEGSERICKTCASKKLAEFKCSSVSEKLDLLFEDGEALKGQESGRCFGKLPLSHNNLLEKHLCNKR